MTTILWIQLIVGLLIVSVGFFGFFGLGSIKRHIVLLGSVNVVYSAAMLVGNSVSYLRVPAMIAYVVFLFGLIATIPRASWREARWTVLLGVGTMLALLALHFLYSGGSSVTQTILLVLVGALAASFVGVSLVGTFQTVSRLRP